MYFEGLLIGLFAFLIIGIFHPIVVKGEYYFSSKIWPLFLLAGVLCLVITVNIENTMFSALFSILSFTCFWSIVELKEQEERVSKGWFPKNPNRPEKLKLKFKTKKTCKKSPEKSAEHIS